MINKQDYHILMEGAGGARDASTRDVSIGVLVSCVSVVIGLVPSISSGDPTANPPVKPTWGLIIMLIVAVCFAVGSAIMAVLAHQRTKNDVGRRSYVDLLARIRTEVGAKD